MDVQEYNEMYAFLLSAENMAQFRDYQEYKMELRRKCSSFSVFSLPEQEAW